MKNNQVGQMLEVEIEGMTEKGYGRGSYLNAEGHKKTVDIPFTTVGDIVRAKVIRKERHKYACQLEEVIKPAPNRIAASCIHFGTCGGCSLQHISYEQELIQKEAYVRKCFAPLIKEDTLFHTILPSPIPWRYRNKMEFSFSQNRQKEKFLGLMMSQGRGKVLDLTECHLANEWFITAVAAIKQWWENDDHIAAYHHMKNCGALRSVTLREGLRTGDRLVMLTVSGNPEDALTKSQLELFVSSLTAVIQPPEGRGALSIFLRIQQLTKGSPTNFFEMLLYGPDAIREILHIQPFADRPAVPLVFQISPTAFFQPNTYQAERLYSRVLQMAQITRSSVVYDLYCGTGTLGICLAPYAKQVISVEISPEATLDARANVALNKIENMIVITSAVRHILQVESNGALLPRPDLVVIDPPRAGLDPKALQSLIDLCPEKIIYISCNPKTQVENLSDLIKAGYHLHSVQPMDQFAQTVHIENIALLVWEGKSDAL